MGEFSKEMCKDYAEALEQANYYATQAPKAHLPKWHRVIHNPDLIGTDKTIESYKYSEREWTARIQVVLEHDWQQLNG